ncbi:MAG: putative Ig domain-containing protein [Parcubacteria group bacterium]|nr:putative Ig domain-containing protein [Parcubacteria group bacterium]
MASMSRDGKYISYYQVTLDSNNPDGFSSDVFVKNLETGVAQKVSVASDGAAGNSWSSLPSISDDGRYATFYSKASNLVSGDTNNVYDVFVHDLITGQTARVSEENGIGGNNNSYLLRPGGSISGDGKYIVFDSWATNLGSWIDTNNGFDVFLATNPLFVSNNAPVLGAIGDKVIAENQVLQFAVTATDPDGDALAYSASNLPVGAAFDSSTGIFSWTPGFDQAGNYADIEFSVMDNGSPMQLDMELITITVGDVNRAPEFAAVGSQEVLENQLLTFTVSAPDPDGDAVVLTASNLPSGASFNSSTGGFSWMPNSSQAGSYVASFTATDNGTPIASSVLDAVITVGDVPTPTEQADTIINVVIHYDFPTAVENSYLANLRKVPKFIEEGKITSAINQLDAFIQKVNQDAASGLITQATGDELIALANALKNDLN